VAQVCGGVEQPRPGMGSGLTDGRKRPPVWVTRDHWRRIAGVKVPLTAQQATLAGEINTDDVRESPALDIIELLRQKGAEVGYHGPYVPAVSHNGYEIEGEPDLDVALAAADCVVVVTDHSGYDWTAIRHKARWVVDTRNAMDQALERMA